MGAYAKTDEARVKLPKKADKKGDLPNTQDGWVRYINELHDAALVTRRKYEMQWVINLAYYMGYQNLLFNPKTGLIEIPRDLKQPLTINRTGSFIESRHSKITKNRPIPRVLPNSNDLEDQRAAKYSDQALVSLWRKLGMEGEYDRNTMLMLLCGTSFLKSCWDPFSGEYVRDYKKAMVPGEGEDLLLSDEGEIEEEKIPLGDVSCRALSAFALLPGNDSLPGMKDQPWIIERSFHTVEELEKLYPHIRGKIRKEDLDGSRTEYEKIVQRLGNPVFGNGGMSYDRARDALNTSALAKIFWMKPNYQYEKGLLAVVVGSELALISEWPNEYGDNVYPYVRFIERENGFSFWGQSTIERLIPIQKAYNRLRQQKAKSAALMANPKWMLAKGSQVHEDSLTDEVGEVVEYNPAVPEPKPAQLAPLPNYVNELARELVIDFRDAGGQRESSVTPPPNITAGVAMQVAAEQGDEIIGPIIRRVGRSMELVAQTHLYLINQEWDDARKIKVFGSSGRVAVEYLSSADLRFHTDVHIEIESMYPDFRGAKRQALLDLWDRRIIDDPKKVLRAFRHGNFDEIIDDQDKKEDLAYLEIARIKKGKMPEIQPFDNHLVFIEHLTNFIQSPEFARLIPERKQLALQVLQARIGMVQGQMAGPMGEPAPMTNQNAVGSPMGPMVPAGSEGNVSF